jgi:hypothetical protein
LQPQLTWLTNKTEASPEHNVSNGGVRILAIKIFCDYHQGYLAHHAKERPRSKHVKGNTDNELVHDCREKEHGKSRYGFRNPHSDAWKVEVAYQPVMDRKIPQAPVGRNLSRVPPIFVENSIPKPKNLGAQIQIQVKVKIEHHQP